MPCQPPVMRSFRELSGEFPAKFCEFPGGGCELSGGFPRQVLRARRRQNKKQLRLGLQICVEIVLHAGRSLRLHAVVIPSFPFSIRRAATWQSGLQAVTKQGREIKQAPKRSCRSLAQAPPHSGSSHGGGPCRRQLPMQCSFLLKRVSRV